MPDYERKDEAQGVVFGVENDFPEAKTTMPYILLASPRTGSSMLASGLFASGLAGNPAEYLHPLYREHYARTKGTNDLRTYLSDLARRRTSPNGRFGMKVHVHQFRELFGKSPEHGVRFLKQFRRFVHIYRRDKVEQAISWMLARQRLVWNVEDASKVPAERTYRPEDDEVIAKYLQRAVDFDRTWQKLQAAYALQPSIDVAYEDLVANTPAEVARVLRHLDVETAPDALPLPATVKLAGRGSQEIKQGFLRSIGISPAPADAMANGAAGQD